MKIEFEGNSFGEVLVQILDFVSNLNVDIFSDDETEQVTEQDVAPVVPEEPPIDKKSKTKQASPKPDPEPEPEKAADEPDPVPEEAPEQDPAAAKQEAIDILMALYNDGKAADVKTLLGEFGVKKFGEISDDRGVDLLSRANDLRKEPS